MISASRSPRTLRMPGRSGRNRGISSSNDMVFSLSLIIFSFHFTFLLLVYDRFVGPSYFCCPTTTLCGAAIDEVLAGQRPKQNPPLTNQECNHRWCDTTHGLQAITRNLAPGVVIAAGQLNRKEPTSFGRRTIVLEPCAGNGIVNPSAGTVRIRAHWSA